MSFKIQISKKIRILEIVNFHLCMQIQHATCANMGDLWQDQCHAQDGRSLGDATLPSADTFIVI